jgi:proteic killer suppression protein
LAAVIWSFRSRALRQFAATGDASKLSVPNQERVRQILLALNAAATPQAMNVPGLKFHPLKGREKVRYAVWASGNYRITFGWDDKDAINVDLEDYH